MFLNLVTTKLLLCFHLHCLFLGHTLLPFLLFSFYWLLTNTSCTFSYFFSSLVLEICHLWCFFLPRLMIAFLLLLLFFWLFSGVNLLPILHFPLLVLPP